MFGATFYLVTTFMRRITIIFEALKDDSLSTNAQHQTVVYVTEMSSKMASTVSQKCANSTSMWFKYSFNKVWKDLRLSMSASVIVIFFIDTYLDHMLAKFEPNRMGRNVQKLSFLTKKKNRVF